jgi:hypothetical protein
METPTLLAFLVLAALTAALTALALLDPKP